MEIGLAVNGENALWEQIKHCKPIVLPGISVDVREIRNEQWTIVRNRASGTNLRLNSHGAGLFARINGNTTLEDLLATNDAGNSSPEELISWIASLCTTGVVSLQSDGDAEMLFQHYCRQKKARRFQSIKNPLAVKVPLHNPDVWLAGVVQRLRWLFCRHALYAALAVIVVGIVASIVNFDSIKEEFIRTAQSPTHWWLYVVMYPALKALHEFAHAALIKRWGGAVHEMGITFLVLMPIPYIDASDAWMFSKKSQRILVSAAGMLAECVVASLALCVFLTVEPGVIRNLAFALFVMGSLSTLLFNANPLLKFDGYYMLQDWLDIPNLASRSFAYCRYLARRYLFRVGQARSPSFAHHERRWLIAYGVLSAMYRCFITMVIALFLASHFLALGVGLALYALYQLLIKPMTGLVQYLRSAAELDGVRSRAASVCVGLFTVALITVGLLPLPSSTRAEGIVWVPQQAQLFASNDGVIDAILVQVGDRVSAGQLVMQLRSPELATKIEVVKAQQAAARVQYTALRSTDSTAAKVMLSDLQMLDAELNDLKAQSAALNVAATTDGIFGVEKSGALIGKHVKQGELLAYVVNKREVLVKAVLPQRSIERMQDGVVYTRVRLSDAFGSVLVANLTRQTPAASNSLPSPALAYDGRSGIAVASQDNEELKTLENVFHIEIDLPSDIDIAGVGGRAYVTLQHKPESLGKRWWRSTRQLLLKQLTV